MPIEVLDGRTTKAFLLVTIIETVNNFSFRFIFFFSFSNGSIYLSIYLYIYLSIYLFIYLSIYLQGGVECVQEAGQRAWGDVQGVDQAGGVNGRPTHQYHQVY